ncbi:MAG: bifunctional adenosylcobinamide kinase/adenosylcobinamide-phosphate guanylyltransferase [Candidatus Binataceae bacterium]
MAGGLRKFTLLLGGTRSGKSAYALALASSYPATARRAFLATAQALDDEMSERIARHRKSRPAEFVTIEEPLALGETIVSLGANADLLVIDSLTLWVSNLIGRDMADDAILRRAEELADAIAQAPFATIVVSDEVGLGIVPDNPLARRFRDLLGAVNQVIARAAENVLMMVAGYPIKVK